MIFFIVGLAGFPFQSFSAEKKVLTFDFEIDGADTYNYLGGEIPLLIGNEIKKAGGKIFPLADDFKYFSNEKLFKKAEAEKASSFIKGRFSVMGENSFMLEAELGLVQGKEVLTFSSEFKGIENLFSEVNKISEKICDSLFAKVRVVDIEIIGNERIEDVAIKRFINTKKGTSYAESDLSQDLDNIYNMGYFGDIRVSREKVEGGVKIIFYVKEKPTIKEIYIRGNKAYDNEKIKKNITLKSGSILNIFEVKKDIEAIKELYREKNYHQCEVSYELKPLSHNRVDITFIISEGEKTYIKTILFKGNKAYDSKTLLKKIKSSEKGFWSWLTGSGEYKKDQIEQDSARLMAFYHTTGYAEARVSEPEIISEGNSVKIIFKIFEGDKFFFGRINVDGDLLFDKKVMKDLLKTKSGKVYNRQIIQEDVIAIRDLYADSGYANAGVIPQLKKSDSKNKLDITFNIQKKNKVYIDKIIISGNDKTRDKVLRREFPIKEQSLYSKARLQRGIRNLYRMDYFKTVNMEVLPSGKKDKVDIYVNVEEKSTGMFTFGAGYSSVDHLFGSISVTQRNFFGKGQTLNLKGEFSKKTTRYTFSFTEPWVFDMPLSAGFDVYNWERAYDYYNKKSTGGAVRFSYPIFDYTRLYWSYTYEIATIDEIETTDLSILELYGDNIESSVGMSIRYDSRDRIFNPTEGMKHSFSVEHAGGGILGGDYAYTKYIGEMGIYFPVFWDFVFFIHGKAGYVHKNSGGILPDYEKFYLGGMNSVRGYDWQGIYVLTEDGNDVGGEKFLQGNLELLFPLVKTAGLMGVLFYDAGNVFSKNENYSLDDLRKSWGYGIRWFSPMGPIRLEYGRMLDPDENEKENGRWEFTMGQAF